MATRKELAQAVAHVDTLAMSALQKTAHIARLTLVAMESPAFWRNAGAVAHVLELIDSRATFATDEVHDRAGGVGCGWDDLAVFARTSAELEAAHGGRVWKPAPALCMRVHGLCVFTGRWE